MSTLRTLREAAPKGGARTPNTFGAVLKVTTAIEENGQLKLTGTVFNEVPGRGQNLDAAVIFRGDDAERAVSNFIKGHGSRRCLSSPDAAAGSFLTLESCYLTDEKQGDLPVISSRWLNTLSVANKDEHNNRSFLEAVIATSPRVQFDNPDWREGSEEPKSITMPVSQPKFYAKVITDHGSFNREFDRTFGIERLKRLPKESKPQVYIDMLEPRSAKMATSVDELKALLTEQLSRGTRATSLLRVTDGEEVIARMVYGSYKVENGEYKPDPEGTLTDLFKNNVFRDIGNEELIAGLASGALKVEAIPGYRLNYAGNPTQDDNAAFKLVQDLKDDKVSRYEMMFGKDANQFASVLLPGIARSESIAGFSPINVISDRPGRFAAADIVTANLDPKAIKASAPAHAEEPAEAPVP